MRSASLGRRGLGFLIAALALAGCSGGASLNPAAQRASEGLPQSEARASTTENLADETRNAPVEFVYVTGHTANNVSAYRVDTTTGALTPVPGSPFAAGVYPYEVKTDRRGRFVYVANYGSGNVSAYRINAASGALTPVPGSPFTADFGALAVAIDPTGKFAYVANEGHAYQAGTVSAYAINPRSGALTAVAGSPFAAGTNPDDVTIDPTGRFAYVPNIQGLNISAYTIDKTTGALTPVLGSPFGADGYPDEVAVDPTGRFAYVTNVYNSSAGGGSTVSAYRIDTASGALTLAPGSPFGTGAVPFGVVVDPKRKFAYVSNNSSNTISGYTIDATSGALTPLAGSPFATGSTPYEVKVDPAGRFAYVADYGSNTVSAYSINPKTGALTMVPGSPFLTGANPLGVTVTRPH